jgi:hypothetical protein
MFESSHDAPERSDVALRNSDEHNALSVRGTCAVDESIGPPTTRPRSQQGASQRAIVTPYSPIAEAGSMP